MKCKHDWGKKDYRRRMYKCSKCGMIKRLVSATHDHPDYWVYVQGYQK